MRSTSLNPTLSARKIIATLGALVVIIAHFSLMVGPALDFSKYGLTILTCMISIVSMWIMIEHIWSNEPIRSPQMYRGMVALLSTSPFLSYLAESIFINSSNLMENIGPAFGLASSFGLFWARDHFEDEETKE